ncbi:MAG: UDP-N-acetylmuramoyl-tripeptide--D-alanyl-D-alanine ligase [Pseudomonadota bacterium]|nr:MAG: UDP-N-acetylmuramoyl-tripeptide--D-alanyl-D-alanine ligase [Pseudomonadota bacterium]
MTLHEAAALLDATCHGADVALRGVSADTRTLRPGQLYVALRGPNFDGHQFADEAMRRGAAAVMAERAAGERPTLLVPDTRVALGQLAACWRARFAIPVVAVTGSNGKTTVKEMLAAIFARQGSVLSTAGNLNNDIGLPLTLLRLDSAHGMAVIEMGANHHGEIAYLASLTRPNVAVITNAAAAHLEGFGSVEGVARAKGEIYQALNAQGTAVINADDAYVGLWRKLAQHAQILSFGLTQAADVSGTWTPAPWGSALTLQTPAGTADVKLALPGRHNIMNALAATAAALAARVPLDTVRAGLEALAAVPGRLEFKPGIAGSRIIDDSYNANPGSLAAALEVLMACPGRHWLALGDMGELGESTEALHRDTGVQVRASGVERLYAIGELARGAAQSFGEQGHHFHDITALVDVLRHDLTDNTTLLVKGSRRMHMEHVVDALVAGGAG